MGRLFLALDLMVAESTVRGQEKWVLSNETAKQGNVSINMYR